MKISVTEFARSRHFVDGKPFSRFYGSEEDLLARVREGFDNSKPGYRDGVILVPIRPEGCESGTVKLHEGITMHAEFTARREGEEPRLQITAEGEKSPSVAVDVILYASTVLAEDGDNELPAEDGNWEVVSINGRPTVDEEPIQPQVLIANHFQLDGGTATGMSASKFEEALKESVLYWKDKALAHGG
jgi:hypothetical protein